MLPPCLLLLRCLRRLPPFAALPAAQGVRRLGSAAVDMCHVASGERRQLSSRTAEGELLAGGGGGGGGGGGAGGRIESQTALVPPSHHPVQHPAPLPALGAGMSEAFWEYRLKPWDMAAGVLVAEEAGGTVTTLDGRAFSGAAAAPDRQGSGARAGWGGRGSSMETASPLH